MDERHAMDRVDRRTFIGASGAAVGLSAAAFGDSPDHTGTDTSWMPENTRSSLEKNVADLVARTPLMDTHEHLPPEKDRVADADNPDADHAPDFSIFFTHYAGSDLQVAGMPEEDYRRLMSRKLSPGEKWRLVKPWYDRCRNTGYLLCARESLRALHGETDLRDDNIEQISERVKQDIRPGFYRRVLRDIAGIEHAQVNCLKSGTFRESEPASDLLSFDLSTVSLASSVSMKTLERCAGGPVHTLQDAHAAIDRAFERFGPRAIAMKDQSAYNRRLLYEEVSDADAAPLFERFARNQQSLSPTEREALQNNLFRRCLRRAEDYRLPVKLHTGYYAGHKHMPLERVRHNFTDLCRIIAEFPGVNFVLMHIGYPYQHELTALCKHYPNVYADMCWAWIIDPVSGAHFMKTFLTAAPACKLLSFGGDYLYVELVPGHARIARRGITRAITELVLSGWLAESDVSELVERVMRGNAHELFDLDRVLRNASGA
ncbi:MAG TPA: amidohydrolase family protein [Candidatus Hydrogenedentes bacterium]|nr:amidohydrolase family protein [Candidatus Hydrogenedentota bacterium]